VTLRFPRWHAKERFGNNAILEDGHGGVVHHRGERRLLRASNGDRSHDGVSKCRGSQSTRRRGLQNEVWRRWLSNPLCRSRTLGSRASLLGRVARGRQIFILGSGGAIRVTGGNGHAVTLPRVGLQHEDHGGHDPRQFHHSPQNRPKDRLAGHEARQDKSPGINNRRLRLAKTTTDCAA
jgi:hypothetical protein